MKKLLLIIPLLTIASSHAMDSLHDVKIVPFDHAIHLDSLTDTFKQLFPNAELTNELRGGNANVTVVIHEAEHSTPRAFIIDYNETMPYTHALLDTKQRATSRNPHIKHYKKSILPLLSKDTTTVKYVMRLGVHPDYQNPKTNNASNGKSYGYGRLLMQNAHTRAVTEECDFLSLVSVPKAQPFYERLGFIDTNPFFLKMAKPLTAPAASVIHAARAIHDKNSKNKESII